ACHGATNRGARERLRPCGSAPLTPQAGRGSRGPRPPQVSAYGATLVVAMLAEEARKPGDHKGRPYNRQCYRTLLAMTSVDPSTPSDWLTLATRRSFRFRQQLPQQAGAERDLEDFDAARGQVKRILDRLREQRADRYGACLSGALDAERIERRQRDG